MSDCIHCDIHELLENRLQDREVNLAEVAAKVTEVLADLILMAPPDEQSTLMADMLANLGGFLLEKKESASMRRPWSASWTLIRLCGNFCFNSRPVFNASTKIPYADAIFPSISTTWDSGRRTFFFNNGFHKSPPRY